MKKAFVFSLYSLSLVIFLAFIGATVILAHPDYPFYDWLHGLSQPVKSLIVGLSILALFATLTHIAIFRIGPQSDEIR